MRAVGIVSWRNIVTQFRYAVLLLAGALAACGGSPEMDAVPVDAPDGVSESLVLRDPALDTAPTEQGSLEDALRANDTESTRKLLEQGMRWPEDPEALFALLCDLAEAGHRESLVLLHEAGADLRVAPGRRGRNTVLHHMAETGRSGIMGLLVELGLGVNVPNREGAAPLHLAVLSGQADAARELLLLGADPNAKTREGKSALELAIAADHAEIVQVLTQPAHLISP